jgi:enoyl-CoA hydratase/carnithine racemase
MRNSAPAVHRADPAPGVALLTLDNPAKLGALDPSMVEQLGAQWRAIRADPSVRAVVLTGTARGFSTGLDVSAAAEGWAPSQQYPDVDELPRFGLSPRDHDVWLPYIVAVNGICAGGGFHLLSEADIVIAAEEASFCDPHVSIGQVAALEPIALARRIPLETVLRMVVLGRHAQLSASEALRCGLVSEVVHGANLVDRAVELASLAALGSPATIEASKRAIWASLDVGLDAGLREGWRRIREHWKHPDYEEGIAAFAEGRAPRWAGAGTAKPGNAKKPRG